MRRTAVAGLLTALLTAACGGAQITLDPTTTLDAEAAATSIAEGEVAPATLPGTPPAEIVLTPAEAGSRVRVVVGDTITVRLPEDTPEVEPWVIARPPDPLVLGTGDAIVWVPSEPSAGPPYAEFVFFVVGTGTATLLFSRGQMTPTTPTVTFQVEASTG